MTYRLLSTGRGVPLSLAPEAAMPLNLTFENVPDGANVYVKNADGAVYYREIHGGKVAINLAVLADEVELGVMTTAPGHTPSRWSCGHLTIWRHMNGVSCVPSVSDLAEQASALALEAEEMRETNQKLAKRMDELEEKIAGLYDGYDIM